MKFKILVLLLFIFKLSSATYLKNIHKTIIQPDGTVIRCLVSGSEYHNWIHDKNGYTIISNPLTGYYTYAIKFDNRVTCSKFIVGKDDPALNNIPKNINLSEDTVRSIAGRYNTSYRSLKSSSNSKKASDFSKINNIVIFIKFSDQDNFQNSMSSYDSLYNYTDCVSVKDYYHEVSDGLLNIETSFYPKANNNIVVSYTDDHKRGYYDIKTVNNPDGYDTNDTDELVEREHLLIHNAVLFANSFIDSERDFDSNMDGVIDNISFIVKGDVAGWNSILWPHKWSLFTNDIKINNKLVWEYNIIIDDQIDVGTICHELFHSLGAPDYYHYTGNTYYPVGEWDLMGFNNQVPQHMLVYTKMKYGGWVSEIPELKVAGNYSLKPVSKSNISAYKFKIPNSKSDDYFVVEYRRKEGRYEKFIPGSGLIIYRVNPALEGNQFGPPDEVYIFRPNGTLSYNGDLDNAFFAKDYERTNFDDFSNPYSFFVEQDKHTVELKSGYFEELGISNISIVDDVIYFDFMGGEPLGADFTLVQKNVFVNDSVRFLNTSTTYKGSTIKSYNWLFEGASPNHFEGEFPINITYNSIGNFDVSLIISNSDQISDTLIKTDYIKVRQTKFSQVKSLKSELFINRFQLGSLIDNSSICSNYSDFNEIVAHVNQKESIDLRIYFNFLQAEHHFAKCFIDWDNNKIYSNENEIVSFNVIDSFADVVVKVPSYAVMNKKLKCRIVLSTNPINSPDIDIDNGEIEDYYVFVKNSAPVILSQNKSVVIEEDSEYILKLDDLLLNDVEGDVNRLLVHNGDNYNFNKLRIIPEENYFGPLTINVSVFDGSEFSRLFEYKIQVNSVNDPPVIIAQKRNVTLKSNYRSSELDSFEITSDMLEFIDHDNDDIIVNVIIDDDVDNYSIDSLTGFIIPDFKFVGELSVKIFLSDTNEGVSDEFIFKIDVDKPTDIEDDSFREDVITCYPNPFVEIMNLKLVIDYETQVYIDIYDLKGKHVYSVLSNSQHPEGVAIFSWEGIGFSGDKLAEGVYIVKCLVDNKLHCVKTIMLK